MDLLSLLDKGPPERLSGYWSIPELGFESLAGEVTLRGQPQLTLHTDSRLWSLEPQRISFISGVTEIGPVLLHDCIIRRGSRHFSGLAKVEAYPLACIFGEVNSMPVSSSWSFALKGLEAWWDKSPIEFRFKSSSEDESNDFFTITMKNPRYVALNTDSHVPLIEISHILSSPEKRVGKITARCWPYVRFTYPYLVGINQFIKDVASFNAFLSLISGYRFSLNFAETTAIDEHNSRFSCQLIFFQKINQEANIDWTKIFVDGKQLGYTLSSQWQSWIDSKRDIETVVESLIRAGINYELDDETRFISSISALERIYGILNFRERVLTKSDGKKLIDLLVATLPDGYDTDTTETLSHNLQFITHVTMKDRLKELVESLPPKIRNKLDILEEDYPVLVSYRTRVAHHRTQNGKTKPRLNFSEATDRVSLLLHVLLLRKVGVPEDVVSKSLQNWSNRALRKYVRL